MVRRVPVSRLRRMAKDFGRRLAAAIRLLLGRSAEQDSWILQQALERSGTIVLAERALCDAMDAFAERYVMTPEIERAAKLAFVPAAIDFAGGKEADILVDRFDALFEEYAVVKAERAGIKVRGVEAYGLRGVAA